MSELYVSNTVNVTDGDSTSHDTDTVAQNINILSAECRWQGDSDFGEQTVTDTAVNALTRGEFYNETTFPYPEYDNFDGHEIRYVLINERSTEVTADFEYRDPSSFDSSWDTTTSSVTIPANDTHAINFGTEDIYGNRVGETGWIDETSNLSDVTVNVSMRTLSSETQTTETKTANPSVSGDVSGSYSGEINDGDYSSWVTMSGLSTGVNTFTHSIGGSNEAGFQFRYYWEYATPTAEKELCVYDGSSNTIYRIALTDPSDSALEYNFMRVAVNGTVYAVDLVDSGTQDALEFFKVNHGTHGIVFPRAFESTSP